MANNLLSINDLLKKDILELIEFSNNFIDDEGNFRKENLFPDKIVANVFVSLARERSHLSQLLQTI